MSVVITPYNGEPLGIINDLIYRAKASWGYSEQQLKSWMDDLAVTATSLSQRQFFLGQIDAKVVLVYSLAELSATQCELEDCWVDSHFHRQGLGTALFEHARHQMTQNGWETMRIVSDPNAQGFYLRMGARRVGETAGQSHGRVLPVLEWMY